MDTELTDTETSKPWQFQKGNDGGPGRPKGRRGFGKQLEDALRKQDTQFVDHVIGRAYENDTVLVAILPFVMKKLGIDPEEAPPSHFTYVEQNYIAGSGVEADSAMGTARMRIADINERADKFMRQNYSTPLRGDEDDG